MLLEVLGLVEGVAEGHAKREPLRGPGRGDRALSVPLGAAKAANGCAALILPRTSSSPRSWWDGSRPVSGFDVVPEPDKHGVGVDDLDECLLVWA